MVLLSRMKVESVALTRQEGEPYLLEGNKLYFTYIVKTKKGAEEVRYGYVDLSTSRTTFTPCLESTIPRVPRKIEVDVNWKMVAYGLWMSNVAAVYGETKQYPKSEGAQTAGYLTFADFRHALWCCYERNEKWAEDRFRTWNITEELLDLAKRMASKLKQQAETELNKDYVPVRQLNEELTSQVLGIFSFNGDKKQHLVTALTTSWGVELKDSDVKVDKFLTQKITLPRTIEELIP